MQPYPFSLSIWKKKKIHPTILLLVTKIRFCDKITKLNKINNLFLSSIQQSNMNPVGKMTKIINLIFRKMKIVKVKMINQTYSTLGIIDSDLVRGSSGDK